MRNISIFLPLIVMILEVKVKITWKLITGSGRVKGRSVRGPAGPWWPW